MKTKLTILTLGAGLSLLAASLAGASHINHVTNGDFSANLNGWTLEEGPIHMEAAVENGEAVITNKSTATNSYFGVRQCVLVQGGEPYAIHGEAYLALDEPPEAFAGVYVYFYDNPNCQLAPSVGLQGVVGKDLASRGSWQPIDFELDAPVGTLSAMVRVVTVKEQAPANSAPATARFDNISLTAVNDDPPQDPPADPTQDPPADPTQDPPADPTQDPPADPTQDPPADPTQDPGDPPADPPQDPPAGPVASVTPAVPPKPKFPDFPEDPVDVFVPGPLGGTPEPATTPTPVGDEPQDPPQPEQPKTEVPAVQPASDDTPAATPTPASPEATAPAVVADTTPLPPSAGNGISASHGPNLPFFAGLALTLLAVTTAAASAAGERMKRR